MSQTKPKFLLILALTISLTIPGSAELSWEVNALEEPISYLGISEDVQTINVVNLTDSDNDDEYVTEQELENAENTTLDRYYNATHGEQTPFNHFKKGYYYTKITPDSEKGSDILYELRREESGAESDQTNNDTQELNFGDFKVEVIHDEDEDIFNPEMPLVAGETETIWVNVTDPEGERVEDVDVGVEFTNITEFIETQDVAGVNPSDGPDDIYHDGIQYPSQTDAEYIMHIGAQKEGSENFQEPYGSQSILVETYPEIEGETRLHETMEEIEYPGCREINGEMQCERSGQLTTEFNVTESEADYVNATLYAEETETGELHEQKHFQLNDTAGEEPSEQGFDFEKEIQIPQIDMQQYENQLKIEFNASDFMNYDVQEEHIEYKQNWVDYLGASTAEAGTYDLEFEVRTGVEEQLLNSSQVNGTVNVTDPNGEEFDFFNVTDMSGETFRYREVEIPHGSQEGIYGIEINITDEYGEETSKNTEIEFEKGNQTFNVNNSMEEQIINQGEHEYIVELESFVNRDLLIATEITGDIQNFTEIGQEGNITIPQGQERIGSTLSFDIEEIGDYSGEIKFYDEDSIYNRTMDIEIEGDDCIQREGVLCGYIGDLDSEVNETHPTDQKIIDIEYLGENQTNLTTEITGDIQEYAETSPENQYMDAENSTTTINLDYEGERPGNFSGTLNLELTEYNDTLTHELNLESTVQPDEITFQAEDIDLGDLKENENTEETIQIENTGETEIETISATSNDYTISMEETSLEPGETEQKTIEFTEVDTSQGQIELEAQTDDITSTETINIEVNMVENFEELAEELEDRAVDLDNQAEDENLKDDVRDIQSQISDITTEYNSENYDEAENIYNQLSSDLDRVEADIRQQDTTGQPNGQGGGQENGSGFGFLPLAIGIMVFLLVGFIGYTSIEVEKGDPLYNVLGK